MAYMSVEEWRKKKESGNTQGTSKSSAASTSSTSGGTTAKTSGYMSLDKWREKKARESVEWWSDAATSILNDTNKYHRTWHGKDDKGYTSLYNRTSDLLATADYWRKQYAGNDDAISYIDSIVSALSNSRTSSWKAHSFYSQWDTEDAYRKWDAYSTPEKRQATYQKNQSRLEELKKERDQIQQSQQNKQNKQNQTTYSSPYKPNSGSAASGMPNGGANLYTSGYQPGTTPYTSGSSRTPGMPYGSVLQYREAGEKTPEQAELEKINDEIARIQTEMEMYKHGNTDENGFYYGSKVVDDYSAFLSDPNYGKYSSSDFQNPTREALDYYDAMMDISTWYVDGSGNTRNRLGNVVTEYLRTDDPRYQISDPLGMYMQATPEDLATMYGDGSRELGVMNRLLIAGYEGSWDQLTKDEVGIYYTILGTQGKEAALKYLSDMQTELNRRGMYADNELYKEQFDAANGWERLGMSALSVPGNLLGGAAGFVDDLSHTLKGEDINPYSRAHGLGNWSQQVRKNQADAFDAAYKWEIPFINFSAGDLYLAAMSAADSRFGAKLLGPKAYQTLMSMGAASSEARELYEQGASRDQIIAGSLVAGAAEWVTEKYSIESLIELDDADTVLKVLKNIFKQGFTEASEEGLSDIINLFGNAIIMGSESDWQAALDRNDGNTWKALMDLSSKVGSSAFSGFVSGGMGGGASVASYAGNYYNDYQTGRAISQGDGISALQNIALDMAKEESGKTQRNLEKQADRLGKDYKLDVGNIRKNRDAGMLYKSVQANVNKQNVADIASALQEQGYSEKESKDIAEAFYAQATSQRLVTEEQNKLMGKYANDETVQKVIGDALYGFDSSVSQRNRSLRKFEFDVIRNNMQLQKEQAANEDGETKATEDISEEIDGLESSYAVSDDGKAHLVSNPERSVDIVDFASIKNGKVMLRTSDGLEVEASDVQYASEADAIVFETIANMGIKASSANKLLEGFRENQGADAEAYARGLLEAFEYGKANRNTSGMSFSSALTPAQLDYVYRQGRKAAKKHTGREQARVIQTVDRARAVIDQRGDAANAEYTVILEDGLTEEEMTPSQKASYEMIRHIPAAMKGNVRIYDGKTGEFGYYDPKYGDIYLNINSTRSQKSMMAFTMGHELVHRAKDGSPAKYQKFADFLIEQYGKQKSDVDAMIAEQKLAAKDHGLELTDEQAFDEVVADACQRMLLDTNAGQRLAEFGAQSKQNQSIVEDIIQWIRDILEKLRSMFADVDPDSLAAQEFAKFDASVKQILADMYVDMTIDAGENLSVIKKAFGSDTQVNTNENGEFTMAQNQDGSQKIFNLATWENGGRETLEATLRREGYTHDEIDAALKIMDAKQEMVTKIANELDGNGRLAFPEQGRINEATLTTDIKDGHAVLSALVSNGDYPVNIDLLMVCKKRKAYQRVINRLCETGMIKQATVDALAIAEINKILGKYGFETACLGCFVESRRLRIQEWAQTIVKEWNGEVKKRDHNAKPFGFGKGEAKLTPDEVMQLIGELETSGPKNDKGNLNLGQGSAVKRMGVLLDKVPSLRRTLTVEDLITPEGLSSLRQFDSNLFSMVKSRYGSNSPKFVQEFNPYNHELAKYGKVPSQYKNLREYLYAIGGARMQSFSDFIVENWFDYCQIVADLAARKLPMHTYTKEIAMVKLFGMTGIKINMSLIPDVDRSLGKEYAGLTRNAQGELELIWADKDRNKATGGQSYMQSINAREAFELQNDPRYSANIGTIAIGISDRQIRMMLNDSRIRMVIPYHASGMNPIFADMMGTSFYKDYTNVQNTTIKQIYNSKGHPATLKLSKPQVAQLTGGFQFNEVLQEKGDARAAADAYKAWCSDSSLHTITIKGETYTAELTPKFNDFADEANYYKLLEDFNTYDCITEQAAPQGDVHQIYPEGFEAILRAELSGQERYRQKQEKNQAFDKAMAEIESYLSKHTKADTVYYAQQQNIKLSKKDSKLDAAGKTRLKQLQEQGASFMLPKSENKKITMSMTDSERTEVLKDKVITAEVYDGQSDNSIIREKDSLESRQLGMIKSALRRIAEEFDVYVDYKIEDVDVKFTFSQGNLDESVSKKITPKAVAKLMPVLRTAVENAIGIESHVNRYLYDTDIVRFDNLVGGYVDGDSFVPVRFGLKHRRSGEVILYVIVDQEKIKMDKIKAEVVKITGQNKLGQETSRSAFKFSLADIIQFVNGGDLLRYVPDDMINESQRETKWNAIADTIKRTNDKNDRKYTKYIRDSKLRVASLMVKQASQMSGYTAVGYHQTGEIFTEFSTERPVSGKNDSETPNGIFLKTNDHDIGLGGNIQMKVFFRAENILHFANRKEANAWYRKNVPGYDLLQQKLDKALKPYLDQIDAIEKQEWDESKSDEEIDELFEEEDRVIKEMGKVEDSYRAQLRELLDKYFLTGESGYDCIELDYDGHRWVNGKREDVHTFIVFHPSQVKSADVITYDDNGDIIPISQRFDSEKKDIRYKLPVGKDTSPRALLTKALDSVITDPVEKQKLQEYRENIEKLNEQEANLRDLKSQIKDLSFAPGPRDTQKIKALREEAAKTENRINLYDKRLLRFEASSTLQKVLQRERDNVRTRERAKAKEMVEAMRQSEKEKYQQRIDAIKERHKATKAKMTETRAKRDATDKLMHLVLDTARWIDRPKKGEIKVPDVLKKPYADFLNSIDLSSKRLTAGGDPTQSDLRLANAMSSLATTIERITAGQDPTKGENTALDSGYLDLPADFVQRLRDMTESITAMMDSGGHAVNAMSAQEVKEISKMIRTLNHAIREVSTLYANMRFANVQELGRESMGFMDSLGEIDSTRDSTDFIVWDNALPFYAFKRFGTGGESVFEGLMDAQDKLAFLAQEIFAFQEQTWNGKEAKEWSEDTHTIQLPSGESLTLTTAAAMSIYCLSRRRQGLQHLLGGGVRVIGLQKGSKKAKDSRSALTAEDIDAISDSLNSRQKKVAEAIQDFMSSTCAEWGNEISMKRFLTREFTEEHYFPIESNTENMTTQDPTAQQSDLFRLLNISATKALTPNANNEVIIRNVFDVFTGHASDMARLNAFGMPLLDYMKWLNYREKTTNDQGQINVKGVRKSMEKAYGTAAKQYVMNLIKDVNGRFSDGGDPSPLMKWMRSAKTASVGNSLRVATLQMTSYPRAALVLSNKNLALGLSKKPNIEKAKKYCGIALWKSFGFYDTNISRTIEDQMKGITDPKQKLVEWSLKGAEIGDALTWGYLWNACEYEVASTKKHKVGSEEFNEAVGKKLREVVYRTQVVDSMLTRSQLMRSKRGMAQEAAAFMSEPTLSANILMDAGFEFNMEKRRSGSTEAAWEKTGKYIGKAVAVYSIGQLTAALLESLWDAWRDDDDEEFIEKYLAAFKENLILDILPFNKIPIVSDVFDAVLSMAGIGFYSSDRMTTTWITNAMSAVDAWKDYQGGESNVTAYGAIFKSVKALSAYYGVAGSGLMREAVALWNNTAGAYDSTLKIRQRTLSKSQLGGEYLDAVISGNDRQAENIAGQFATDEEREKAIRAAIKNRFTSGEIGELDTAKYLVLYGGLDASDAHWNIEKWVFDMSNESGEDYHKYDEFLDAVKSGENLDAVIEEYLQNGVSRTDLRKQISSGIRPEYIDSTAEEREKMRENLLAAMQACGMSESDADNTIGAWEFEAEYGFDYSDRKTAYLSGEVDEDLLKKALVEYGGYDSKDAELQVQAYDWEAEGYEGVTTAAVRNYSEYCAAVNVPKDIYMDIRKFANSTENDVVNGEKVPYSAVKKIMREINYQTGLTPAQKTAIAKSIGWKDSTIQKYKLW